MNQGKIPAWNRRTLKDPHRLPDKRRRVREMFASIAGTYDLLNHLLSFNRDRSWRWRAVELARIQPDESLLDLCCGTGDLALAFAAGRPRPALICGVDFVEPMLRLAQNKVASARKRRAIDRFNSNGIIWLCSDAELLPFADDCFDCASCAFGLRNLQHLDRCLREMHRILKPTGRCVILEFALPENRLLAGLYAGYFRLVLPWIATMIAWRRKDAYLYLPESVRSFGSAPMLIETLRKAGFEAERVEKLSGGIVMAYVARKP
ncbi:MAG: bifunctional demethylmenaquinone methyltransferase/2-methoxy-6-polyprenyl-1,4-benzoquinol methylase UbiE [Sedimentisphaerales bacterium]|nr:bifunctional demethylmenaquinone methyltransferase/2-methoxy-6-polyprenyl-1,4-benzoquinol methylase UbiE [Sedimentisphaerales bacterium]